MAKTFTAPFAQTPKTGFAECTAVSVLTSNTPTNTVLLATAGADGCIVTSVKAIPRDTVTATGLYLFISDDGGTTKMLVDSELMEAHTYAETTEIPETSFSKISETVPIRLEAGDELYVAIGVATTNGIVFKAEFTDF